MASLLASSTPCLSLVTLAREGEVIEGSLSVRSFSGPRPRGRFQKAKSLGQQSTAICQVAVQGPSSNDQLAHFSNGHFRGRSFGRRRGAAIGAKRKESATKTDEDEELDADLRVGLNEVSNEAIRVMLSDDIQQVAAFQKKVDYLGEYLVGEGYVEAARFMLVLRGMLDHTVPVEHEDLKGAYRTAFEKIGGIMEDSGWLLAQPGEEPGAAMEMADEELIPPVLRPY